MSKGLPLHGRDHRPGGADPIPATQKWARYSSTTSFTTSSGDHFEYLDIDSGSYSTNASTTFSTGGSTAIQILEYGTYVFVWGTDFPAGISYSTLSHDWATGSGLVFAATTSASGGFNEYAFASGNLIIDESLSHTLPFNLQILFGYTASGATAIDVGMDFQILKVAT